MELGRFPAVVVGEEDEAAAIEAFQQQHSGGDFPFRRGRGHGERLRERLPRRLSCFEPELELHEGIGVKIDVGKRLRHGQLLILRITRSEVSSPISASARSSGTQARSFDSVRAMAIDNGVDVRAR